MMRLITLSSKGSSPRMSAAAHSATICPRHTAMRIQPTETAHAAAVMSALLGKSQCIARGRKTSCCWTDVQKHLQDRVHRAFLCHEMCLPCRYLW